MFPVFISRSNDRSSGDVVSLINCAGCKALESGIPTSSFPARSRIVPVPITKKVLSDPVARLRLRLSSFRSSTEMFNVTLSPSIDLEATPSVSLKILADPLAVALSDSWITIPD